MCSGMVPFVRLQLPRSAYGSACACATNLRYECVFWNPEQRLALRVTGETFKLT